MLADIARADRRLFARLDSVRPRADASRRGRRHSALGSGNIGATNVLRTGRKDLAAATVILDALKGTVTVLIAWRFGLYPAMAAALGAFLGHLFPVWLGFRGGKGVATFVGCMIGLYWPAALAFAIVWLGVAFVTRYSSAAGLAASVASVIVLALLGSIELRDCRAHHDTRDLLAPSRERRAAEGGHRDKDRQAVVGLIGASRRSLVRQRNYLPAPHQIHRDSPDVAAAWLDRHRLTVAAC